MTPPTVLYSLRSEIDAEGRTAYRITKFVDGEVESSYHTSREACECPAGVRPSCRHRQMLPHMLNANIANTHWFLLWPEAQVVDFEGTPRSRYTSEPAEHRQTFTIPDGYEAIRDADGRATGEVRPIQPHSVTVSATDFDSSSGGSNPPAVANKTATEIANTPLPTLHEPILEALVDQTLSALTQSPHPWRRL